MPTHPDAATITHVLNRIGFGPRPGDVAAVERMGLAAYIDAQLHPERIDDSALDARLASFETLTMSSGELAQKYFLPAEQVRRDQQLKQQRRPAGAARPATAPAGGDRMMAPGPPRRAGGRHAARAGAGGPAGARGTAEVVAELTQARMLRAVLSERQLQEVMTDFWFNHFNVFIGKGQVREYLTEYERDAIRPHVLGSFPRSARRRGAQPGDAVLSRQLAELDARTPPRCRRTLQRAAGRPAACRRSSAQRLMRRRRAADAGAGATAGPRHQRELRARADGAAHAGRRRRLHAERRRRTRADSHGLDDRPAAAGRRVRLPVRRCTTRAPRRCSA